MRLADALSGAFTVYVPDRRGRGRSEPYGEFHGLSTEIEDLSALLDASGATRVFGLSSGAVIVIEAALVRPDITKLALYEPPLPFDGVVHGEWDPRYEQQLTAGDSR
jgi:pimeloyl-ACP methyl ester carboxylesterase